MHSASYYISGTPYEYSNSDPQLVAGTFVDDFHTAWYRRVDKNYGFTSWAFNHNRPTF
jgi:hypothetical protein